MYASSRSAWSTTTTRSPKDAATPDAADWRRAHEDFFTSDGVAEYLGAAPVIGDDTLVVTERFRLVGPGA